MGGLFHTARGHGNVCNNRRRFTVDRDSRELSRDFGLRFFEKVLDTAATDVRAEELGCEIGDLVCLVEDDGIRSPEDVAEAVLLQSQIREQEVVVDDHDVGVERFSACNRDVTA